MDAEMERVRESVIRQLQPMLSTASVKGIDGKALAKEAARRVEQESGGDLVLMSCKVETGFRLRLELVLERVGGEL